MPFAPYLHLIHEKKKRAVAGFASLRDIHFRYIVYNYCEVVVFFCTYHCFAIEWRSYR